MLCDLVKLWSGSSQVVEIPALTDQAGAAVTTATVTVTLYEADGTTQVAGVSWPVSLSHTNDPPGEYQGSIPYAAELVVGSSYIVEVVATDGALRRTWRLNATAAASG